MWEDFHKHNRMVRAEECPALECPDCHNNLIVRTKPDASSDLFLWCAVDDIYIQPGMEMHHQIKNTIRLVELQRTATTGIMETTD
jgi:hypothetical protein